MSEKKSILVKRLIEQLEEKLSYSLPRRTRYHSEGDSEKDSKTV